MKTCLFISILVACSLSLRADEEKSPIDLEMEAAIEKDSSTAGMVQAASMANKQWDAEMNSCYQKLKKTMKPDEWEALVTAQRAWLAYRDAQIKSLVAIYDHMEGTMWIPVSASSVMEITKHRALFLKDLGETISER